VTEAHACFVKKNLRHNVDSEIFWSRLHHCDH